MIQRRYNYSSRAVGSRGRGTPKYIILAALMQNWPIKQGPGFNTVLGHVGVAQPQPASRNQTCVSHNGDAKLAPMWCPNPTETKLPRNAKEKPSNSASEWIRKEKWEINLCVHARRISCAIMPLRRQRQPTSRSPSTAIPAAP